MTIHRWSEPTAGEILWCHFPDNINPRPKPGSAPIPSYDDAIGTARPMHSAGLSYDTTFDLRQTLDLQYTTESHWRLKTPDLFFILSEHALLASEDWSLSCVLDAWGASGAKVLSITWEPDRPWTPPQAVRLANGPWREVLIRLHRSQGWLSSLHRELPLSRCG